MIYLTAAVIADRFLLQYNNLNKSGGVCMGRKLFCEISPFTYRISTEKCRLIRNISDLFSQLHGTRFASVKDTQPFPVLIYRHQSLIRRKLGQVDMTLQENKAVNLSLAAPQVNGILIRPGETFSFWRLVGDTTEKKGYKTGLTIKENAPSKGIGGGMCQFTNLIHWMILHSPLTIVEHHHHDGLDLFPDFGRQIPFGTGTSILYNYKDYRFRNDTDLTFQLLVHTTDKYLSGELRASAPQPYRYHIYTENEFFSRENGIVYRNGKVLRDIIDPITGNHIKQETIRINHARVLYNTDHLTVIDSDQS